MLVQKKERPGARGGGRGSLCVMEIHGLKVVAGMKVEKNIGSFFVP